MFGNIYNWEPYRHILIILFAASIIVLLNRTLQFLVSGTFIEKDSIEVSLVKWIGWLKIIFFITGISCEWLKMFIRSFTLPQHYLKNWLTYMFYFSSANEEIFLFHVLFDATVGETSLDFFFDWRQFFFGCLSFLFFLELALHERFSLFVLFQAFFIYFELVSDVFLPHQIFSN